MSIDDWILWEPSPARDALWSWWFSITATPCCGNWNEDWSFGPILDPLIGFVGFYGLLFLPLILLSLRERSRSESEQH